MIALRGKCTTPEQAACQMTSTPVRSGRRVESPHRDAEARPQGTACDARDADICESARARFSGALQRLRRVKQPGAERTTRLLWKNNLVFGRVTRPAVERSTPGPSFRGSLHFVSLRVDDSFGADARSAAAAIEEFCGRWDVRRRAIRSSYGPQRWSPRRADELLSVTRWSRGDPARDVRPEGIRGRRRTRHRDGDHVPASSDAGARRRARRVRAAAIASPASARSHALVTCFSRGADSARNVGAVDRGRARAAPRRARRRLRGRSVADVSDRAGRALPHRAPGRRRHSRRDARRRSLHADFVALTAANSQQPITIDASITRSGTKWSDPRRVARRA